MKYKKIIPLLLIVVIGIVGFVTPRLTPSTAAPPKDPTVIWVDDFESETVKWLGVGAGSVTRSTTMAFNGDASLNVTALAWNNMEALRQIGSPGYPIPVLTVDFWFAMPSTGYGYFIVGLEYCSINRDTWYRSGIDFSGKYENEAGHWVTIEGFPLGLDLRDDYQIWHYARLSVDLANGNYLELTIDDYTIDLQSLGYKCCDRKLEGPPAYWGICYPYFYSGGWNNKYSVLIDDVRLCKQ